MKFPRRFGTVAGIAVGMAVATGAVLANPFSFGSDSRLWIEGTSTVRSFTCEAGEVRGDVQGSALTIGGLQAQISGGRAAVAVESLDCRNGTMNSHMRKAFKADQHPMIEYRLSGHEVVSSGTNDARVRLTGDLSMAGQTRPITLDATATVAPDGVIRVRASKEIVMSEYGMKPPSLMMGTMKVGDRVTVHFDVAVRP